MKQLKSGLLPSLNSSLIADKRLAFYKEKALKSRVECVVYLVLLYKEISIIIDPL